MMIHFSTTLPKPLIVCRSRVTFEGSTLRNVDQLAARRIMSCAQHRAEVGAEVDCPTGRHLVIKAGNFYI